jgi:hypothetical protein
MVFDERTMTVYYPSLVCNLQIRFDEGLTRLPVPATTVQTKAGAAAPIPVDILTVPEPLIMATGSDNLSQVLGVVPKVCSVELPGYRQAGTFSMTLEYQDLPLDPRVVRAMRVDVHLGAVEARDFGDGMTSTTFIGQRPSILAANNDNLLIVGLADSINVYHGKSGSTVQVEGRDLRGLFLDTPIAADTLRRIDLSLPIDEVVSALVNDLHPQGGNITVEAADDPDWPGLVVPSPGVLGDLTRVNLDAGGQRQVAGGKGEASKITFWDLITQYCTLVGAVPYFKGRKLLIKPARSLYYFRQAELSPAEAETPFDGALPRSVAYPLVQTPEDYTYRRLVFGHDIEDWKMERKLGGVKVPAIRCVSVDTSSQERGQAKLIEAVHPPETQQAARTTSVGTGGQTGQSDELRISIPGIKNRDRLKQIAEDLYEEIGRQEIGGSVQTKNLASFGGDNQDPDLLKMRPGDPVEFRVNASGLGTFPPPISELTQHTHRLFEDEVAEVAKRLNGDENMARVLVASNRGEVSELVRTFRVNTVKYDWSAESGVGISFDFQNYIEARYAVTPHGE